jgi:diguanylate cyclase
MDAAKDSPSEIAKQTLTRLAKDRRVPSPENYCDTFRKVEGRATAWASFCRYTGLLEGSLAELLGAWQSAGSLLDPDTARIARELGQLVPAASTEDDLRRVRDISRDLGSRLKRDLAGGAELLAGLIGALRHIVANLSQLGELDHWLRREIQEAEELLTGHITAGDVAKARDVLLTVVQRQHDQQNVIVESQAVLKEVMSELVLQAASLVTDTAGYQGKISALSEHISAANDISSIKNAVGELNVLVKDMGQSLHRSHDAMAVSHTRLLQAEEQILDLRKNLAETSERVRRDKLTGALNRSGLDEIWLREVTQAKATAAPLSIGILDVDNFKLLNDEFGHVVGDEALVHLAAVIRNALHGTDTMARYGGEEFVILLPDTDAAGGDAVMRRLQRELTKHFFMRGNDRLLITFSAGVTLVNPESDSLISAVERADTALYEAKRLGKNRVSTA